VMGNKVLRTKIALVDGVEFMSAHSLWNGQQAATNALNVTTQTGSFPVSWKAWLVAIITHVWTSDANEERRSLK
jgi:hypothetical protein